MNRKSIGTALLLLAILAALAFIWGNSLDSAVESAVKSGRVRELLQPLLERLVGQGGVTDHLVRKLAHFTEFAVLGALLLLLTAAAFRVRLQSVVNCLFFLLLAIFTGRTAVSTTLNLIAVAVLIYSYFRIFSRNIARRQAENQKFLKITAPVRSLFGKKSADKTHRIFSCPKCGQKMRVPMGKGKIEITCPNCRNKFIKRS